MPLVFNGTTIPTNVANALKFNGSNVTTVVFNGTTVWQQSLCTICTGWSGTAISSGTAVRIETSGYLERLTNTLQGIYGAWLTITPSGTFVSGTSSDSYDYLNLGHNGGTTISMWNNLGYGTVSVSYSLSSKTFSGGGEVYGGSRGYFQYGLYSSGSSISFRVGPYSSQSNWISLT